MRRATAFILAVCILLAPLSVSAEDAVGIAEDEWYSEAAVFLTTLGLMELCEDGSFDADGSVTNGSFACILAGLLDLNSKYTADTMKKLCSLGWFTASDIAPDEYDEPIDRQTAAKLICTAFELNTPLVVRHTAADLYKARPAMRKYINAAVLKGCFLTDENDRFRPLDVLTNAEAAYAAVTALGTELTKPIAVYVSKFNTNTIGRTVNMWLSASKANGLVLETGDEFSFNDTVGQRTYKAGYRNAYIIAGGGYVMDLGGGICQTASNLFHNALHSGMLITERYQHGISVVYADKGLDATIYWGMYDLRFQNTLETPVCLRLYLNHKTGLFYTAMFASQDAELPQVEVTVTRKGRVYTTSQYLDGERQYTCRTVY